MKLIFSILLLFVGLNLWASPYAEKLPREDFEYLVVATHSFDGQINAITTKDGAQIGGIENTAKYIRILRKKYGDRMILLHAGSLFKKENTPENTAAIVEMIKALNYDAILPAETDFVHFRAALEDLNQSGTNILSSNLLEPKSGELLFKADLVIKKKYDIQVMGVFSLNHMQEKYLNPNLPGIYIKDEVASVLENLNDTAKVKILLGGFNQKCQNTNPSQLVYEWGEDPGCEKKSDIYFMMRKMPKDTVDLIINQGGTAAAGYLKNTIISQAQAMGKQISLVGISYFQPHQVFDIKKSYAYLPVEVCLNQVTEGNNCRKEEQGFFARLFGNSEKDKKEHTLSFLNSLVTK